MQQRLKTSEIKSTWYFSTISHIELENYYQLFYPEGNKIIPNDLEEYLTPCGIAYWFMDDGTKTGSCYSFATASFSFKEHEKLLELLNNKYNLVCSIHRKESKQKSIYVSAVNESNVNFKKLIEPFIVESMKYKL